MKTLADFKRALKVGTKWEAYNYIYDRSLGIREVAKVDTVKVGFKSAMGISYCDFPKASMIKFNGDTVEIYGTWANNETILKLSYRQVTE